MPPISIGVVYSSATGRVRSYVIGGHATDVVLRQGELLYIYPNAVGHPSLDTIQVAVNAVTGKNPTNDLYAIVDGSGNVIGAVTCDLALDSPPPGCQLIQKNNANAFVGGTWSAGGGFVAKPQPAVGPPHTG